MTAKDDTIYKLLRYAEGFKESVIAWTKPNYTTVWNANIWGRRINEFGIAYLFDAPVNLILPTGDRYFISKRDQILTHKTLNDLPEEGKVYITKLLIDMKEWPELL